MREVIYKYPLEAMGWNVLDLPPGALVLTAQAQHGAPVLWVKLNPDEPKEPRRILVAGTGHDMPHARLAYLSTLQLMGGGIVCHVFEEVP